MPDQLNKQTLINLLIDSPLREPIKINLIDIVNNTTEPDLPKVYSTITKELEIFQKATERRMKLAEETILKLGGTSETTPPSAVPPLDLPPLPQPPVETPTPIPPTPPMPESTPTLPTQELVTPSLDLPPLPSVAPTTPVEPPPLPPLEPIGGGSSAPSTPVASSDETALAEIQKELESLKSSVVEDASPTPPAPPAPIQA